MRKYSLLLFDLDDTLLMNCFWFYNGLEKTLKIHPLTEKVDSLVFIEQVKSIPKSLVQKLVNKELTSEEFTQARWKYALDHFNLSVDTKTIAQFDELFFNTSMDLICENKSVTTLMNDLQKHYDLGIVTNGLYDPIKKIYQMGLSHVFTDDKIFHSEKLDCRKPHPKIYTTALDYFGRKPKEALLIGDSWTHDVVGPIQVGMDAIWINLKGISKPSEHHPVAIVSELSEIRPLLLEL